MKSRKEMTDAEIDRLDNLEWKVRCFLSNINPSFRAKDAVKPEDWDMDAVSAVIEAAWESAYKNKGICTEHEFYPYRDEDDEEDGGDPDFDKAQDCFDFQEIDQTEYAPEKQCSLCANWSDDHNCCSLEH